MREWPEFGEVTCLAIACPSCMTLDLARSCSTYVTTIINGADLIPTVSAGQLEPSLLCPALLSLLRPALCSCSAPQTFGCCGHVLVPACFDYVAKVYRLVTCMS